MFISVHISETGYASGHDPKQLEAPETSHPEFIEIKKNHSRILARYGS